MKAARSAKWFAVSAILALERRRSPRYLVFENVYLFRARSAAEASKRGAALARREARAVQDATWNGERVRGAFAGVRKVVECAPDPDRAGRSAVATIHDGVEATYSQFIVASQRDLKKLAAGRAVDVVYEE